MIVSEEEALKKLCVQGAGQAHPPTCCATFCMAWRWSAAPDYSVWVLGHSANSDNDYLVPTGKERPGRYNLPEVEYTWKTPKGYCGLAYKEPVE